MSKLGNFISNGIENAIDKLEDEYLKPENEYNIGLAFLLLVLSFISLIILKIG